MCQALASISTSLHDVKHSMAPASIFGGFLNVFASSCLPQGCYSVPDACCWLLAMVAGQGKRCADASLEMQGETSNFPERGRGIRS